MANNGVWVDLAKWERLGSGQVRVSGLPRAGQNELSLWDAAALHEMKAVSEILSELGFFDQETEEFLDVQDIRITSTPWAGLTDDERLKVEIKVKEGTKIGYAPI